MCCPRKAPTLRAKPPDDDQSDTEETLRKGLRRLLEAAGIERRITPHSFRHSFVTLALDAGVDIRDLMASTGHTDPSMIMYYDRARAAIERNATHTVTAWVLDVREK